MISEVGTQLTEAYSRTVTEFRGNPEKMSDAWQETLGNLQRFDPAATRDWQQIVQAHAYVSILEQVLFSAINEQGSNGNR